MVVEPRALGSGLRLLGTCFYQMQESSPADLHDVDATLRAYVHTRIRAAKACMRRGTSSGLKS